MSNWTSRKIRLNFLSQHSNGEKRNASPRIY
jgi:hypothetical protein